MPFGALKRPIHALGRRYIRTVIEGEAQTQTFRSVNERPIELQYLFGAINRFRPQTVLDVGTGTSPLPALIRNCGCIVTAIDNVKDYWPSGMQNRHWKVLDADIRRADRLAAEFDMVSCISVIEHIAEPELAMQSMARLVNPDGRIVLTMPYSENNYVPDVYSVTPGEPQPYICRSASRTELTAWLMCAGLDIEDQEYWKLYAGDFWRDGKQLAAPEKTTAISPHQLTCLTLRRKP